MVFLYCLQYFVVGRIWRETDLYGIRQVNMIKKQLVLTACMAVALTAFSISSALAQGAPSDVVKIRKVTGGKVRTPDFKVSGFNTPGQPKEWFAVVVEYDTAPEWVDSLDFEFNVVLEGDQTPKFNRLRGVVSCQNIARGSRHKEVMYIHPSTLARYGVVKRAAVLVKNKGVEVGAESSEQGTGRWWEQLAPVDGLLLNRLQTPFAFLQYDEYESIVPAQSGR